VAGVAGRAIKLNCMQRTIRAWRALFARGTGTPVLNVTRCTRLRAHAEIAISRLDTEANSVATGVIDRTASGRSRRPRLNVTVTVTIFLRV